jgi:hypothetical protein
MSGKTLTAGRWRRLSLVAVAALAVSAAPAAALQLRYARQEVPAAQRQGPAAVRRLAARVMTPPAKAADASAPSVGPSVQTQALAVALYEAGSSSGDSTAPPTALSVDRAGPIAHAASCWGPAVSKWWHNIAGGATVARLTVTNPSWCGNGSSITYGAGNWDHQPWSNYPYCLTSVSNHQGWDKYPSWGHGGIWGTAGVYTIPFVCAPILGSNHATLRVAANGYSDHYDDFGF